MRNLSKIHNIPWLGFKLLNGQKRWFKKNRFGEWIELNKQDRQFYTENYPKLFSDNHSGDTSPRFPRIKA